MTASGDWSYACNCGASWTVASLNELLRLVEVHGDYCQL